MLLLFQVLFFLDFALVNVKWISQVRSCLRTMNIGVVSQEEELEEESSVTLTKPLTKQTNFDPGKLTASKGEERNKSLRYG